MNNKPPVILQVLPSLESGGVERGTIEITRAIKQGGGVPLVASAGGKMTGPLAMAGGEHITLPLTSKNPFTMWRNAHKLANIIRKYKVDVVHARSRAPAWSAWLACERTGCHFITTFHGTYGLQNDYKKKYNAIMTRGERVIAISHFIADHILKNYEVNPNRLRIIHRGVDLKLFNPGNHSPQRMIALAQEWRLPEELPVILFPGRISRWKGQDVFIRALAQLPHRHFFAIILGDDKGHETFRKELEQLVVELKLDGHVRIAHHTYNVSEAYMLAKLVVAASIEPEAFGRVALEAQAMGRPIIATNHGGAQETVIPNVTGWLVTPGSVEELSAAIEMALTLTEPEMESMRHEALINAERFSIDVMCNQTLSVYEEVIA